MIYIVETSLGNMTQMTEKWNKCTLGLPGSAHAVRYRDPCIIPYHITIPMGYNSMHCSIPYHSAGQHHLKGKLDKIQWLLTLLR